MKSASHQRILLVDDEVEQMEELKVYLERQGYQVVTATDGQAAVAQAQSTDFDLVVLDINLPDKKRRKIVAMDGIEVLRILRELGNVPVLMLSTTNIPSVKVMALALGADDYVPKPFDLRELVARIQAILRRAGNEVIGERTLSFIHLKLDPGERRVWKDGRVVDLTGIEFDILHTLAQRPKHVFSRSKIIEVAWKNSYHCVPKAVDVHIGHIRKKLEKDPAHPVLIVTVRGSGYRFEEVPA